LQFFDFCPVWTAEVEENEETYEEQRLFSQSVEVEDVILRINLKLGFLGKLAGFSKFCFKFVQKQIVSGIMWISKTRSTYNEEGFLEFSIREW
jgi:hypothetical protein